MTSNGSLDTVPLCDNNSYVHNFGKPLFSADGTYWWELLAVPQNMIKTPGVALSFNNDGEIIPLPTITGASLAGTDMKFTKGDGTEIIIDMSNLNGTSIQTASLSNTVLTFTKFDSTTFNVSLAGLLDDQTLEATGSVFQVKGKGIRVEHINDSAVTTAKISDGNVTNEKLASSTIGLTSANNAATWSVASPTLGGSSELTIMTDNTTINVGPSGLKLVNDGVTISSANAALVVGTATPTLGGSTELTVKVSPDNFNIDSTVGVEIKDGGIANVKLANKSIGLTSANAAATWSAGAPELGGTSEITVVADSSTIQVGANGIELVNNTIGITSGNAALTSSDTTPALGGTTTLSIVTDDAGVEVGTSGLQLVDSGVAAATYPPNLDPTAPSDSGPSNATQAVQVTVDSKGRVTAASTVDLSQIRDAQGADYKGALVRCVRDEANNNAAPHVEIIVGDGSTRDGAFRFYESVMSMENRKIVNLLDPVDDQDAVTKKYLYDRINGLSWMSPAQLASKSDVNISQSLADPFDGVDHSSLPTPFRILLAGQTNAYENGVWEYNGSWSRPSDYANGIDARNKTILVEEGSLAGNIFSQTTNTVGLVVGTATANDTTWTQITGGITPTMTGSTTLAAGNSGLAPQPVAGTHYSALLGNATFGHTEKIILQPSANSEVKFGTTSTGLTHQVAQTGDIALKRSGSLTSTVAVTEIKDNFDVNAPLLHIPGCAAITQHSTTSHAGLGSAHNVAGLYMGVHLTSKPYLIFTTEKTIGDENSSFVDFKHTDDTAYRARFQYLNAAQNTATDANYIPKGFTFIGTAKTSDTNWGLSVTAARETFAYNLTAFNSFYPSHPSGSGQIDIGSSTKMWKDVYLSSQIYQDPIIIGDRSNASDASTNTTALSSGQIAIGIGAKLLSSGTDDIVIGSRATCTGTSTRGWNVVMGPDAYSTGGNCIVIGEASGADGGAFGSIAMGYQAYAWDKAVNIAGKDMMHKGDVVIGYGSGGWQPTNSNDHKFASVCIGYSSSAQDNSISIGDRTQALGEGCILLGSNARITQGTSTLLIAGSATPATGTLESSMPFPNSFGGYGLLNGDGSPVDWDPEFSGDPHANYGDNCIVIDMSNTGSTYSTLTGKTNNVLVGGNLTVNDLDKSILIGHKITANAKTTSIVLNASDSNISIGDSVDNNTDNGRCYIAPIRQRTADENDVNIMYDSVNKELVSVQGQFLSPTGSRLGTPSEFTLREVQNNNTAPYAGFVGWNPGFTQNGITGWFQSMATFYSGIPGVEFGNYTTSLQVDDELEMTYNNMGEHTVATVFVASIPNDNSFNVKDANGVVLNDAALASLGFLEYKLGLEYEPKVTRAGTPDLSAPTRNILYPRWDYSTKEFGWDDMLLLYGATSGSLMLQAADTTSSYAIQFPAAGGSARKRLEISTVTTGTSETCQLEWTDRVYLPNNVVEEVHTSGTFEVGKWYEIVDPGTTDFFNEQNADGNFPTIQFQAITAGTGTGTARNLPMIVSLVSGHGVGTPNTDSYHIGFPVDVSNVQVGQVLQISGITTAGGYMGTKMDLEFANAPGDKFNALYVDNTSYFDDQSTTITGGHDISSALLIRRGSEALSEQTAGVYPYTMVECHAVHHDHVDDSNNETTAQNNANALGSIINESNLFGFTNIKFKTTQSGSGAVGGSSVAAFPVVTYIASGHGYFNSSDPTNFNKSTNSHDRRRDSNIAFFTSRDNADLGSGDNQNSELDPKLAMLISPDGRVGIGGAKDLKGMLQISQRHGDANVVTRNRAVPFITFTGSDTDAKANTVIGDISRSGESSVVYNTSSDYRVKKNVTDFSGGLGVVNALLPKSFNFIDDSDESKKTIGFLAHEVSHITNGVITGEKDAIDEDGSPLLQKIDHSKLVPYLVSAVQELSAANQALMARVASLEEAIKISSQS